MTRTPYPTPKLSPHSACYINDNGCHVLSIAPFLHIAFYMTLKDENALELTMKNTSKAFIK